MKFVLLHETKNDEGIRAFFMDVWELYVKVCALLPVHSAISGEMYPRVCRSSLPCIAKIGQFVLPSGLGQLTRFMTDGNESVPQER